MRELHVNKRDLRVARAVEVPTPPLADGAARLAVDVFALTANNMTYAAMGDGFAGYWDFFPGPEGWGRPPAWGFGTVVASAADGVDVGTRYYGFYPIGESLDVIPAKVGARGFVDNAPHRAAKAPIYNRYVDTRTDPAYEPTLEWEQALLRPLYPSGWWAADRVHQASPRTIVISSASSKTALSAAHRLRRLGGAELVALTSARNSDYVAGTGMYDRTLRYDDLGQLSAPGTAAYMDFLGRDELTAEVHRRLRDSLETSLQVGITDWTATAGEARPSKPALTGPSPEFVFVPEYAASRLKADPDLGAAMLRDLRDFYGDSRAFMQVRKDAGGDAIVDGWARLAAGTALPREGLVLSFS